MPPLRPSYRASAVVVALVALAAFAACGPSDHGTGPRDPLGKPSSLRAPGALGALAADPVIVAAGDVACGTESPAGTACKQAQTAALIGQIAPNAVLVLGDLQYENGSSADFNTFYGPTWGQYKSITYPAIGNHEYSRGVAPGYFDFFNGVGVYTGRAGDRDKGYYSYDLGAWHLIALNSNCANIGGCGVGSPQEQWLRADLVAHVTSCALAYWHHPRFSSGPKGSDTSSKALWQALMDYNADVVLTGHDHDYERFAPQNAIGVADNVHGLREWVVGTGGKEQLAFLFIKQNSVVRSSSSLGVLKMTLHPTSYDWQFVPVPGDTLSDSGTATCNALVPNRPPAASIASPSTGTTVAKGTSVSFVGSAVDPESGVLSDSSLVWTSSIDGRIGIGTSFSTATLSVGTHTVTLTGTDPQGLSATTTVAVTVTPVNAPPTASISAPVAGMSFAQGTPVTFTGAGTDPEDGALSGASLAWSSSVDGALGTGASVTSAALSLGAQTITLTATDSKGATGVATIALTILPPAQSPSATNQPPSVSITAPASGSTVTRGTSVSFVGAANDPETGPLGGASLVWTSSIDGALGTGTSVATTTLSLGTHTITLTATDPLGASTATAITVVVVAPNAPPTASISAPSSGASFVRGSTVSFSGAGNDPEDGVLSGASLAWTSSRDGALGTGTSLATSSLSVGTHSITLTATDSKGATGTAALTITVVAPNTPPTATIAAPASGTSVAQGTSVSFSGSGSDAEDGVLSGASLVWTSSIDGQIGTGTSFATSTLSLGTHTITLKATDSQGATGTATQMVTIVAPNHPPTASISAPASGASVTQGTSVTFTGAGTDPEDGTLSGASLVWTSSINGQIGTGATFATTALSTGTHTITLTAKDAQGATGTATRTITVTASTTTAPAVARVFVYAKSGIASPTWQMHVGATAQFAAIPYDASGKALLLTGRSVTFASSAPAVLTVDPVTGIGTGVKTGTFAIRVTIDGVTGASGNMSVIP